MMFRSLLEYSNHAVGPSEVQEVTARGGVAPRAEAMRIFFSFRKYQGAHDVVDLGNRWLMCWMRLRLAA